MLAVVLALACTGGYFYTGIWRSQHHFHYPSGNLSISGIIINQPTHPKPDKTSFYLEPIEAIGAASGKKGAGALAVTTDSPLPLRHGDHITVQGQVTIPSAFADFNYPFFLETQGVSAVITKGIIERSTPSNSPILRLQNAVHDALEKSLPEPDSAFAQGLILGEKAALPASVLTDLNATNTSHLVSLNGTNIALILTFLIQILPVYTRRQKLILVVCISALLCCIAGFTPSIVRGSLTACLMQAIRASGRKAWPVGLIATTLALLVLYNPLILFNASLQLSVTASLGLIVGSGIVSYWLKKIHAHYLLPPFLFETVSQSTAITLATAPVSIFSFGQLSLISIPINALLSPFLPALVFGCFLLLILGKNLLPLIQFPLVIALNTTLKLIHIGATVPFGVITLPNHA